MITLKEQNQGVQFMNKLIQETHKNVDFKNKLIANPHLALSGFTENELSHLKEKKIIVEDQSNSDFVYINIPAKPDLDNLELTDEQLEAVAGGEVMAVSWWVVVGVVCLGGGVGVGLALR
jgi:hypothetical protein